MGKEFAALTLALFLCFDGTWAQGKRSRERETQPPPSQVMDKRDRAVALPGSRFHGKAYWQALGQCGGIYFKLNTLYADAAAVAQVVKKDIPGSKALRNKSEEARRVATAFFDGAERVLTIDRKLARTDAILTYDAAASDAADRLKSVEAALDGIKPCPALYEACRKSLEKICSGTAIVGP